MKPKTVIIAVISSVAIALALKAYASGSGCGTLPSEYSNVGCTTSPCSYLVSDRVIFCNTGGNPIYQCSNSGYNVNADIWLIIGTCIVTGGTPGCVGSATSYTLEYRPAKTSTACNGS